MPTASRGDRSIHYEVGGEGSPVILIPGLGAGSRLFGTLPRRFERAGFRCATPDPVGVPPSSPHVGDYDLDEAARDIWAVADNLGIDQLNLVGTSMGGKVALCAATLAPERVQRVVLVASSVVVTERGRRVSRVFEIVARRLEQTELAEVMATFLFGHSFHRERPEMVNSIIRSMKFDSPTRDLMIAQARAVHTFDGTSRAANLPCPCLCLAGSEDTLTDTAAVRATAELMPNGQYEEIRGAGHTLLLESGIVFDRVTEFLEGGPRPRTETG